MNGLVNFSMMIAFGLLFAILSTSRMTTTAMMIIANEQSSKHRVMYLNAINDGGGEQSALATMTTAAANDAQTTTAKARSDEESMDWLYITLGVVAGIVVLALIGLLVYCLLRRKFPRKPIDQPATTTFKSSVKSATSITMSTLAMAQDLSTSSKRETWSSKKKADKRQGTPSVGKASTLPPIAMDDSDPGDHDLIVAKTAITPSETSGHQPSGYFSDSKKAKKKVYFKLKPVATQDIKSTT